MTKTMTKTAIALTALGAVALPASQAAAGTSKTESAIIGALLGGVAGAAVGDGRTESVVIGAAAGAAVGVAVDKSNDHKRRTYRGASRYRQAPAYSYYGSAYPSYGQTYYGQSYYAPSYGRYDSGYGYDSYYGYRR